MSIKENNLICPLSNTSEELEIIEVLNTQEIVKLYKSFRHLDLSNEFNTKEIYLVKNKQINFYFFYPFISGSSNFYEALTTKPQYAPEKDEYHFASKYIKYSDCVLDVGCGWGWFKSYIPNSEYLGIEFSQKSIQKCKDKNINVTSVLIEDFAKQEKKFDVVTSFQVLEHIENPIEFIQGMINSAKDNGLIIISVPNVDSFMACMENNYLNLPPHHISWWSKDSLFYVARKLNLEIIDFKIEKSISMNIALSISLKRKLNTILGRKQLLIRNNLFDRFVNKFFSLFGLLFRKSPEEIMPNGHSITFIFRKK